VSRVTIERMDLELEVVADDREVFARLFREHIEAWSRAERERAAERARQERDRSVRAGREPGGQGR
jgi:hypothetical protein